MLTLSAAALALAVSTVSRGVIAGRNTIPILSTVRLTAAGGRLTVDATDLDILASYTVDASDGDLSACVNGAQLLALARAAAKGADVGLSWEALEYEPGGRGPAGFLTVAAGRSSTRIVGLPTGDFPVIADPVDGCTFIADGADMRGMIAATGDVAATCDVSRPALCGVYMAREGDALRLFATDGHRAVSRTLPAAWEGDRAVTLPRSAAVWLGKALPKLASGDVSATLADGRAAFTFGAFRLVSKLLADAYPVALLDAREESPAVRVDALQLADCVDLVLCGAPDVQRGRRMVHLSMDGAELRMACRDYTTSGEVFMAADADAVDLLGCAVPGAQIVKAVRATFQAAEEVELRTDSVALVIRSTTCAEREVVIGLAAGDGRQHDTREVDLDRPLVTLDAPTPVDHLDVAGPATVRVDVVRSAIRPATERREVTFPTRAAAARAFVRLRAALARTCDLTVTGVDQIGHERLGQCESFPLTVDPAAPMSWFTRERAAAYSDRVSAIHAARGVFATTDADTVPWPRAAVERPIFTSLRTTPASTLGASRKPEREYAAKILRDAAGEAAPPPPPPKPVDWHVAADVARTLSHAGEPVDTGAVLAFMEASNVRTYRGFLKRHPWPRTGLVDRILAAHGEPEVAEVEVEVEAPPAAPERVRIWVAPVGAGWAWGEPGCAPRATTVGFIAWDGAVADAREAHPGARIVVGQAPADVIAAYEAGWCATYRGLDTKMAPGQWGVSPPGVDGFTCYEPTRAEAWARIGALFLARREREAAAAPELGPNVVRLAPRIPDRFAGASLSAMTANG